jgi:hypothetical protein
VHRIIATVILKITIAHRQVPLEALSVELEGHLQTLRNRLVEVINEDYADFVSLSSKLVNVDSSVLRMQRPLLDIQVGPWGLPVPTGPRPLLHATLPPLLSGTLHCELQFLQLTCMASACRALLYLMRR